MSCGFTCVLFSLPFLILSPSLWPSWALCSEATPTTGTVPAAEVTGRAWDDAGGAQPRRRRRGRRGMKACSGRTLPVVGTPAVEEDVCRGGDQNQTHSSPLTHCLPSSEKENGLEGSPHTWAPDLFSGAAAFSELTDYFLEPPGPLPRLDISEHRDRICSLWVPSWAPRKHAVP